MGRLKLPPESLRIGPVVISPPVVLAPMAGVTDATFRLLCREYGAGLVITEMISDQALIHGNLRTEALLDLSSRERPVAIQLFGSRPDTLARAAAIAARFGPDLLDLNMGCPVPKIVRGGAGAALMREPDRIRSIVEATTQAFAGPVTVKIRKGWDEQTPNAVEAALAAVEGGATAVTVHGRLRSQGYSGRADWEIIGHVKQALTVPVIGNGDVDSPSAARAMLNATGCDGIMVGRAALGRPWIFAQIAAYLQRGENLPEPPPEARLEVLGRHLDGVARRRGERIGVLQMRKHAAWYVRGLPGAVDFRRHVNRATTVGEMSALVHAYRELLASSAKSLVE